MPLKTLSGIVGIAVAVGGAAVGFTSWVWASSADSAKRDMRLEAVETHTEKVDAALRKHVENATAATMRQDQAIRDLGALQLEQGEDQRRILLRIAPRGTKSEKSPELREAEARVRRQ